MLLHHGRSTHLYLLPLRYHQLEQGSELDFPLVLLETTLSITPVTFITDSLVYVPSCSPISHLSPLYHVIAFFAAPYCKIVTIPSVFRKKNLMMIYTIHANQRARLSGY